MARNEHPWETEWDVRERLRGLSGGLTGIKRGSTVLCSPENRPVPFYALRFTRSFYAHMSDKGTGWWHDKCRCRGEVD